LELNELADVVSPSGILDAKRELLCYQYIAARTAEEDAKMNEGKAAGDDDAPPPPMPSEESLRMFLPVQYKPRSGRGWEFKYTADQPNTLQRGIFYWLGTKRGKQAWRNPSLAEFGASRVVATSSSTANGSPNTATARNFENGYTQATQGSWYQLELPAGIAATVAWYQISTRVSAGGSPLPLRNWRLEAKRRHEQSWTTLSEHNNDQTLPNTNSITRSFRCNLTISRRYYHMFRIFQFGGSGSGGHQLNFGESFVSVCCRLFPCAVLS